MLPRLKLSQKGVDMKIISILFFVLSFSSFASEKSIESLRQFGKAFSQIAKESSPGVVFIKVEKRHKIEGNIQMFKPFGDERFPFGNEFFERFFKGLPHGKDAPRAVPRDYIMIGQGSGFIISANGHILTNHHVIGGADKVMVNLLDGRLFEAKVIGTDEHSDIALLKINAKNLPILKLGDSNQLEVGEWVVALGNPFGLTHSLTAGIVSAIGRSSVGVANYENFIQTDASINPGNSGGPLINLNGEVVGMNTAIINRSGGYMGIGFAIPINMVKLIKDQLIEKGSVDRGYLGVNIQNIDGELALQFDLQNRTGVLISDIGADTPAQKDGLKVGDVILEFDGKQVKEVGAFRNMVALTPPGKKATIKILRNGKVKTQIITLGKIPKTNDQIGKKSFGTNEFGFKVGDLTHQLRQQYNIPDGEKGVVITHVDEMSLAGMAGLKEGDLIKEVNRYRVGSVKDFKVGMKKGKSSDTILLLVKGGQVTQYITLSKEPLDD